MTLTRRSTILGGLSLPFVAMMTRRNASAGTAATLPSPLMMIISGASSTSDPTRLVTLLHPFLIRNVPVALTLSPFDALGGALAYDSALAVSLRACIGRFPGGVEFGLHDEVVETDDPYFQLRRLSTAQAAFSRMFNDAGSGGGKPISTALTLTTCSPVRSAQDCASLRAAAIRSVVHLPGSIKAAPEFAPDSGGYWMTETGLVNVAAQPLTSTGRGKATLLDPSTLARNIGTLTKSRNPIVVNIGLETLADMSEADLAGYATKLAQTARAAISGGGVRGILPSDLYFQSRQSGSRFVVLRVGGLRLGQEEDPSQHGFVSELLKAGYPVTQAEIPMPYGDTPIWNDARGLVTDPNLADLRFELATHGWQHRPEGQIRSALSAELDLISGDVSDVFLKTGRMPAAYVRPDHELDDDTLVALAATGTRVVSAANGDFRWHAGMDRHGLLHVSNTVMFERDWSDDCPYHETDALLGFLGSQNDAVFSIHPHTATTPQKKQRIWETLEALSSQPGTKLVNFEEYRRQVLPPMPVVERIRNARTEVLVRDVPRARATRTDEAALREDAALAWSYFDWGAKNFDGMAPATSWIESGAQKGYPFTTMWDIGTYILATFSAHRIGVIDRPTLDATANRILAFLDEKKFRYKGVDLPATERALGADQPPRDGFDSADTGRLLIALKILDEYTAGSLPIARVIRSWGLEKVLIDGEMHIIKNGRARSAQTNSYAGYVSRGYRMWGHSVRPVFETVDPTRDMDEAVRVLSEIRKRGRIATEPHITEEIELGGSPHGRLMADLLYAAQIERYRTTGILTCTSEGPVAGPPYFTYQGYQIDETGGQFVIDAPTTGQAAQAAKRGDALRLVSTKAAYLWHAARPGTYSDLLINYIRARARMPGMGFSAGVFEAGDRTELTDLNTNGLILEAIAYILNDRKPFLQLPDV